LANKNDLHHQLKAEIAGGSNAAAVEADSAKPFVHLNVHSAFSLLEGALPLQKLIDLAVADNQPALAITDRNNLFGALEFSTKAAGKGLQPIMGIKIAVDFDDADQDSGSSSRRNQFVTLPHLVLLAMNEAGYQNLMKLGSHAHVGDSLLGDDTASDPQPDIGSKTTVHMGAHVSLEVLSKYADDLICLTGGGEGPINLALKDSKNDQAKTRLSQLNKFFADRLYVELQRHGTRDDPREQSIENPLLALAYENDLPIVATNQPLFGSRDDYQAHDALVCIAEGVVVGSEDRKTFTEEYYFKTAAEMNALFADLPEATDNTLEIAQRCSFRSPMRDPILPRFAAAEGEDPEKALKAEANVLREQTISGLQKRMEVFEPAKGYTRKDYDDRLEYELGVIEQMGFPGYFLIVADFIQWAKNQGIPVGPGRGSGAGSLVAWALTITDIDPMRFSLLFERFLNPERVSMPDFDIDFCQDRREEVIRYVQEKYGREQVAQIITFGTLQARAVLRDVGRVLQLPYGQVDRIAKLVPANPANPVTLKEAID